VNRLFESFVSDYIVRRASFAVETTLRSSITFDQAATARREGFFIEMHYLALDTFARHVERIKIRADKGGHSAPESVLRGIYDSSLRHHRRIRDHDVSVFRKMGGHAVRIPATPVPDKSGNLAFAQSTGIRLAVIGCRRLRASGQNQKSQRTEY
jgi:hypothetical protein